MTSPEPNPTLLAPGADDGQAAERAIDDAMARLDDLSGLPVSEHVERFEAVHSALTEALNKAENLLSGTHSGS